MAPVVDVLVRCVNGHRNDVQRGERGFVCGVCGGALVGQKREAESKTRGSR